MFKIQIIKYIVDIRTKRAAASEPVREQVSKKNFYFIPKSILDKIKLSRLFKRKLI